MINSMWADSPATTLLRVVCAAVLKFPSIPSIASCMSAAAFPKSVAGPYSSDFAKHREKCFTASCAWCPLRAVASKLALSKSSAKNSKRPLSTCQKRFLRSHDLIGNILEKQFHELEVRTSRVLEWAGRFCQGRLKPQMQLCEQLASEPHLFTITLSMVTAVSAQ